MSKINQLYEKAAESYAAKNGTEYDIKQSKDSLNNELTVASFANGQRDCRNGLEPKKPATKAYLQGYGFQYSVEQVANHRSVNNENIK